jgi:hypothetical protein
MATPDSNSLPAPIPPKTAPKPRQNADPESSVQKRVFKRRNRKIASCTNCRSRKVGCDKGPTCSQCRTKGLHCVYIDNAADLAKSSVRVVKKRNRRVTVCLNCRRRKVPCNQRRPCRACEDESLDCVYQPYPKSHLPQQEQEPIPTSSDGNKNDLPDSIDEASDSAVRGLSPGFVLGRQSAYPTHVRQGKQSGMEDHSASGVHGRATSQYPPQHHHRLSHANMNQVLEPRRYSQDRPTYGYSGGVPQARYFGRNLHGEQYTQGTGGAAGYGSQQYLPPMGTSFQTRQLVPYNHNNLPPIPCVPVQPQPIRSHLHPPCSIRPCFEELVFPTQMIPNYAPRPRQVYEQPKPDALKSETAIDDPISYADYSTPPSNPLPGASNRPSFPDTLPSFPRLEMEPILKTE